MEFTLKAEDLTTITLSVASNPDRKYMLKVEAADNVIDGFGRSLQSSSSKFRTESLPSFFASSVTPIVVFPSTAVSSGVLDTWPVVAHGKQIVDETKSNRRADMHCTPVTESNFAHIMVARLFSDVEKVDIKKIWATANTQKVKAPMTDRVYVDGCPDIFKLLEGSLTGSRESGMFYVVKRGRSQYSNQQIVVISDMSAVFIPSQNGKSEVTAWVTDATGADVAGAVVKVYSLPTYGHSISNFDQANVVLAGTSTTGSDGLATVQLELQDIPYEKLVGLVTDAGTGGVAFEPKVPMPAVLSTSQWNVRLHTDRGLYKPGDDVHVKVVARVRLGASSGQNGGRLVIPTPSTKFQYFLSVRWTSRGPASYVPVIFSEEFGTANLKLKVPMDADFGPLLLTFERSRAPNQYESLETYERILIADPRPPTVSMDLSLHSARDIDTLKEPFVVPPRSNAKVDVRVVTKTQTGALVENAKVVVSWTLARGFKRTLVRSRGRDQSGLKLGADAPLTPKARSTVYGLDPALVQSTAQSTSNDMGENAKGEFTILTAVDGVGRVQFDLASALREQLQAPAQDGDILEIKAQWIGPTREVVRETKTIKVAESPFTVGVSLSIDDPLPGIPFGVRLDVRAVPDAMIASSADVGSNVTVESDEYTLSLYKWTQAMAEGFGAAIRVDDNSLQLSLLEFLSTQSSTAQVDHDCKVLVNDHGVATQCDGQVKLPDIGEYLLVVQNKAVARGDRVAAALLLGRSLESWQAKPLTTLTAGLGIIADRPIYSEGDVATLTFVSPFAGTASVLSVWGNFITDASSQKKFSLQGAGKHTFTIKLGAECRGGCAVNTIVTAPAQSASVELPVTVPLSKLLQTKVSRTVIMRTVIAVRDLDIPDVQPKVTISLPSDDSGEFVVAPGKTTDLVVDVDMTAYSGGKAEVMLYVTDQAFLDLEPHPLPALAPFFTLDARNFYINNHVTDTRRYSASAAGLQSTIATFKRRFAKDPWVCPGRFPLLPDENLGWWHSSGFNHLCGDSKQSQVPEVDEMDESYFGRHEDTLTHFPGDRDGFETLKMRVLPSRRPLNDLASPSTSASKAPTTSSVALRTNMQTTPLFIGSAELNDKGHVKLAFTAPDNIARFAVRAVVVGDKAAPGVFGEAETHLIVRKPLSLIPSQPRIVRSRDTFSCGVTVTLQDAKFDGTDLGVWFNLLCACVIIGHFISAMYC